jgi:hypothetical protein
LTAKSDFTNPKEGKPLGGARLKGVLPAAEKPIGCHFRGVFFAARWLSFV